MFQLTISANSPEELNQQLITYVAGLTSGALIDAAKGDLPEAVKQEENEQQQDAEPTGRRSSRRNAEPAAESTGRRGRSAAKENPVNDDEEQAALRAQLITDLQVLADDEKAHKAVSDALARVGAKNVHEIASASLGDFNEDIQPLLAETDSEDTAEDDSELRAKVITDLKDLQDVIDNPENEGEDTDVTETLKKAYTTASAKPRGMDKEDAPEKGVLTSAKNLDKIAAKDLPHFAAAVSGLIEKYFG